MLLRLARTSDPVGWSGSIGADPDSSVVVSSSRDTANREKTESATAIAQRTRKSDSAPRGGWLLNRLLCLLRGHRRLMPTAAAAKILPNGTEQEIYLCHACGSYAWRTSKRTSSPSWLELRGW
jgi:hypothetical protein